MRGLDGPALVVFYVLLPISTLAVAVLVLGATSRAHGRGQPWGAAFVSAQERWLPARLAFAFMAFALGAIATSLIGDLARPTITELVVIGAITAIPATASAEAARRTAPFLALLLLAAPAVLGILFALA